MEDMKFPPYFADAEATIADAKCVIFGVPFGNTSSFRPGAEQGPSAIRQASWNFETFDLRTGKDLVDVAVHDYGDVDVEKLSSQEMVDAVEKHARSLIQQNKVTVALGGEHAITPGIVKAFPKDIGVLIFDAHLDFREQYEDDPNNHACVTRRIIDHIPVENIALLGARSAEKEEYLDAQHRGLFYRDAFSIQKEGIEASIKEIKTYLGKKPLYISLDIDVIDPAYAPGTSTPEPFGLTPLDILKCLDAFAQQAIGFDVVEVCPPFDKGETALLAAKLVRSFLLLVQ